MTDKRLPESYQDLLYLIRCAVRQEKMSTSWQLKTPLSTLLKLAQFHSIEALLFDTVKQVLIRDEDKPVLSQWQLEHDKAFRRYLLFTAERQAILEQLEQEQIWSMVLKGVVLQADYPQPHYRQMSDNDILFDKDKRVAVRDIMVARGYDVGHFNYQYDDVYYKEPCYNFEMHVKAFVASELRPYFANLPERLLSPKPYSRQMTSRDFYLYLLSHELKHYKLAGTGLRSLIDLQFYLAKHQAELNWEEIDVILSEVGVLAFEQQRRYLVEHLFSDDFEAFEAVLDDDNLAYYCSSGTYGTLENSVTSKLAGNASFMDFYGYKFFNVDGWIVNKPGYYKWFVPFFVVYRAFRGLFNPRNWQELKLVLKKLSQKS